MIPQWANLHISRRNLPVWHKGIVMNDEPYFQTPECKLCMIAKPCNAFLTRGEIFISASCPFKPEAKQLMLKSLQWYATFKDPNLICLLLPLRFWLLWFLYFYRNLLFPLLIFLSGCNSPISVRLHVSFSYINQLLSAIWKAQILSLHSYKLSRYTGLFGELNLSVCVYM